MASAKLEKKLFIKIRDSLETGLGIAGSLFELMVRSLSSSDHASLFNHAALQASALQLLALARKTLAYSFVFAYYHKFDAETRNKVGLLNAHTLSVSRHVITKIFTPMPEYGS
jgi:hypothetical protein